MATRALTSGMLTQIQANTVRPVVFYEGEYGDVGSPDVVDVFYLRLWTGVGNIDWNGNTWTGAGTLMNISQLGEASTVGALSFTVSLTGMPSAIISLALQSIRQGRAGKLWLGAFDSAGALVADPYLIQQGRLDLAFIDDEGTDCSVSVQYESRLVDLLRPRNRRYTTEDQKLDHPSDQGFDFVPQLQEMNLIWGGPAPLVPNDVPPPIPEPRRSEERASQAGAARDRAIRLDRSASD